MTPQVKGFGFNNNDDNRVLRVACYARVSTLDQAMHGFSIEAQLEMMRKYCKDNRAKIVDEYVDAGHSGSLPPLKRPALKRLLEDVEAGKIDKIIFVRIDRWFRNIREYFKTQEILEENNVTWKSLTENYATDTADGQMAISIFLAVAENERNRTRERIQMVFDNKRQNKEVTYPEHCAPFGYRIYKDEEGKRRLIKDEDTQEAVQFFFDLCVKYQNVNQAARAVSLEYGINRIHNKWKVMVDNEVYTGTYKGVKGYCEPYISREDWEMLQSRENRVRTHNKNRIYLFAGLILCPECNRKMAGSYTKQLRKGGIYKEYKRYRCQYQAASHLCGCTDTIAQNKAEKWLLNNLSSLIEGEIARVEIEQQKPRKKPKTNIQALREKLRRLDVVYMNGNLSDDEYMSQQTELKNAIAKAEAAQKESDDPHDRDLTNLQKILETDFKSIYNTLDDIDKRRFWRSIIKRIYIKKNEITHVDFQ